VITHRLTVPAATAADTNGQLFIVQNPAFLPGKQDFFYATHAKLKHIGTFFE
jgi:hypothetical protein